MKQKLLLFVLLLVGGVLLSGCGEQQDRKKGDDVTIFYSVSNYAMFGADQNVIDKLLDMIGGVTFERTEEKLDLMSAFMIGITYQGKSVRRITVDRNGVFWLDGDTICYKSKEGTFDYDYVEKIYYDSKKGRGKL